MPRCRVAATPLARMKGLLGRDGLEDDEAMLLKPASAIHTCFMRFAIDAVFLDADLRVLEIARCLKPWRLARARGARAVLELAAGAATRIDLRPGVQLSHSQASSTA